MVYVRFLDRGECVDSTQAWADLNCSCLNGVMKQVDRPDTHTWRLYDWDYRDDLISSDFMVSQMNTFGSRNWSAPVVHGDSFYETFRGNGVGNDAGKINYVKLYFTANCS
jgi:hypothetical protein